MNPRPHSVKKHGWPVRDNTGCGFQAMRNDEDSFWQSRMTRAGQRAELPDLVSLPALARKIRAAAPHTWSNSIALYIQCIGRALRRPKPVAIITPNFGGYPTGFEPPFSGIPARALTPTGSFNTAVDRSALAAAGEAGWGLDTEHGSRCVEQACGYAEAARSGAISDTEARILARAAVATDSIECRMPYGTTINRA